MNKSVPWKSEGYGGIAALKKEIKLLVSELNETGLKKFSGGQSGHADVETFVKSVSGWPQIKETEA
ncbi:MAG: hypothetical protein M0Z52_08715 [Actinomycetota bacterium]|nr:hypothetical protein [Actinomycetota bacterium]